MRRMKRETKPSQARRSGKAGQHRLRRWLSHPAARIGAAALFFAVALGGPTWLWRSGWVASALVGAERTAISASVSIGLTVQEILLEGRTHTPRVLIKRAVGLDRGDPIMGFDPESVRRRLEAISWVRSATVARRLPGIVHVRIVERRPMALWQRGRSLTLIDAEGVAITEGKLDAFKGLLVIAGRDAPSHTPDLLAMLAKQPALRKRARAAVRVGARRWNLRLDNGIDVRLPEYDAPAALARLARLDRRHGLLDRDIDAIDLRLPDRLILRPRGDAKPAAEAKAKDRST